MRWFTPHLSLFGPTLRPLRTQASHREALDRKGKHYASFMTEIFATAVWERLAKPLMFR